MNLRTLLLLTFSLSVTLATSSCNNEKDSNSTSGDQATTEGEETSGPTSAERQQWEETLRNLTDELTTDKMKSYTRLNSNLKILIRNYDPSNMRVMKNIEEYFDHLEEVKLSHRKLINKLMASDYPEAREVHKQVEKFYDQLEFYQSKMIWACDAASDYSEKNSLGGTLGMADEGFAKQAEFVTERIKACAPIYADTGEMHIETIELLNDLIGSL